MVIYNYKLDNFLSTPTKDNKLLKIFNKNGILVYTINPNLSYFFYKNNLVIIKVDNQEDIKLDFETVDIASKALTKLNDAKKTLILTINDDSDYYLKNDLDSGQLDNRYYTSAQTNILFSLSGHSHNITDLNDVIINSLTINDVLSFDGDKWINSAFTFDVSEFTNNFYTSAQTNTLLENYSLIGHEHNNLYYEQNQFSGSSSGYTLEEETNGYLNDAVLDIRYYPKSILRPLSPDQGAGILDNRYYTKIYSYNKDQIDSLLSGYTSNSQIDDLILEDLKNVISGATNGQTLSFNGSEWVPVDITSFLTMYWTNQDTITYLSNYSLSSHTHNELYYQKNDVYNTTEITDFLTYYSLTTHTHNDIYYTKDELDNGLFDSTYAKNVDLSAGTLDWRYLTITDYNNYILNYSLTSHTHDELYYNQHFLYTKSEIDSLLTNYFSTTQTDLMYIKYGESFLSGETLTLLANYIPLNGSSSISGNLIPSQSGLSLGSLTNPWSELYLSQNTLYIDGVPITVSGNNLIVNGNLMANLNDVSSTSHTHDDRYYIKEQFSGSSSGYSYDETNVVGGPVNDAVLDYRYIPFAQFNHNDPGLGGGILDNRYWTKLALSGGTLDWRYLRFDHLNDYYTIGETDFLLSGYMHSIETNYYDVLEIDNILNSYYTNNQINSILSNYSLTGHNHDNLYYSKNLLYTSTQIDQLLSNYFTSGQSDARFIQSIELFDYFTSAETMNLLNDYSLTSHTHNDIYYTKTELNNGQLDNIYGTKIYNDVTYQTKTDMSNYYTSIQTNTLLTDYYTTGDTNLLLLNYSLSSHTHILSDLSDILLTNITDNDILIYSAGTWINSALTLTNYYLKDELDNGVLDNRYYTIDQINDTFYTSAQTNEIFFTSGDTLLILTGYSLTEHVHDDRYYIKEQFSGSSSGYSYDETNVVGGPVNDAVLDNRYVPFAQFNHTDPGLGGGILDNRYYTKYLIDGMFDYIYNQITGVSISGSSVYYTNYNPVPEAIGGVEVGDIFVSGTTFQDVVDRLLYPYQTPSFSSFSNGMGGTLEIGSYITDAIHTNTWETTNSNNINIDSIQISGDYMTTVTNLNNTSLNSGQTDIYISGFTGLTNKSWTIQATNTENQNFTKIINMSFKNKNFWGNTTYDIATFSGLSDSDKSLVLQGLTGAGVGVGWNFNNTIKGSYNGINGNTKYLIFAYNISSTYTIQFKINGLPNTAWSYIDFTYKNINDYEEIYRVYISDTAQNSPISLFEIF